jgi:NUMOD4 motif/HNH endonuclease
VTERWLPVVGWEGLYEVSDQGRVRSLDRRRSSGNRTWPIRGRILKPVWGNTRPDYPQLGYYSVAFSDCGRREQWRVHRIVLTAFVGPSDLEALHSDGNHANNALSNLRWGSSKDNARDRITHGRQYHPHPDTCFNTKVSLADREAIRLAVANGASQKSQCEKYGLSSGRLCFIVNKSGKYGAEYKKIHA